MKNKNIKNEGKKSRKLKKLKSIMLKNIKSYHFTIVFFLFFVIIKLIITRSVNFAKSNSSYILLKFGR